MRFNQWLAGAFILAGILATPAASWSAETCQPKPGKNACETCHENQCCAERRACENDAACAKFLSCLKTDCDSPPCNGHCGLPPQAYVQRFVCQMNKCNTSVCGGPVDPCTLCASTTCAVPTLACLNTAGCYDFAECLDRCGQNAACRAQCKRPSAAAVTAAEARAACLVESCRSSCGRPS